MSSRAVKCDVLIVGGGLVGITAAVALAEKQLNVVLLDAADKPTFDKKEQRELRVSAISAENLDWLKSLGVCAHLDPERLGVYRHMCVWDNESDAAIDFTAPGLPHGYLGTIIENRHLQYAALMQADRGTVTLCFQQKIAEFETLNNRIEAVTESGDRYRAQLLLAADGARSGMREKMAVQVQERSYKQKGIVGYIRCDDAPSETALQGFNCGGPIGLLPCGEGLFSYVWSVPEDTAEDWVKCEEQRFVNALKMAINRDLGAIELASPRAMFPLRQLLAKRFCQGRTVLCGDAAHVVHPLAGQGANLGIGDVKLLSEVINQNILKDDQQLSFALRKYQRRRYSQVRETTGMIDALHGLFGNRIPALQWLRSTGMRSVNRMAPLKQWLMQQAGS